MQRRGRFRRKFRKVHQRLLPPNTLLSLTSHVRSVIIVQVLICFNTEQCFQLNGRKLTSICSYIRFGSAHPARSHQLPRGPWDEAPSLRGGAHGQPTGSGHCRAQAVPPLHAQRLHQWGSRVSQRFSTRKAGLAVIYDNSHPSLLTISWIRS